MFRKCVDKRARELGILLLREKMLRESWPSLPKSCYKVEEMWMNVNMYDRDGGKVMQPRHINRIVRLWFFPSFFLSVETEDLSTLRKRIEGE